MNRITAIFEKKSIQLVITLFCLIVAGYIIFDITLNNQGGYLILFSLIYVLIPGFLFAQCIDRDFLYRFRAQSLIISFFLGFSLLIIQYYLLNAAGHLYFIKITPLVLIILFAVLSRKSLNTDFIKTIKLVSLIPYLALFTITLVASYVVLTTSVIDETSVVHVDYSYHMGNVNILTRGGTLEDTRVMGMTFKYHYFMDLYYAILRLVFPAKIWNCIFRYPILLISPLVTPSIYAWAKSKTGKAILSFGVSLFIVFFPSIYPWQTKLTPNILNNYNGVGFALPLAICLSQILMVSCDKDKYKHSDLIFVFMLTACLSGTKGPFALILTSALIIFVIYFSISMRKISFNQILTLLTVIAGFALVWFTLLNVAVNDQNVSSVRSGILKYFDYQIQMPDSVIFSEQASNPAYFIITLPISMICCFGGAAIPFLLLVPYLLVKQFTKKSKNIDFVTTFAAVCGCIGIGGADILSLDINRVYFMMFSIPFVYIAAIGYFELIHNNQTNSATVITVIILVLSSIGCCTSLVTSILNPEKTAGFETLTQGEIDGINWIKTNTDDDALFAINDPCPDWKFYYYSGFSERRFYIESYYYAKNSGKTSDDLIFQRMVNDQMFTSDNTRSIAENLNVDYLIYFDRFGNIPEILEDNYHLCFCNDCLRIYSVR